METATIELAIFKLIIENVCIVLVVVSRVSPLRLNHWGMGTYLVGGCLPKT